MEGSAKRRRISENDGIATTEGGGTALSPGYDFEVFLSFRGPDTRSSFTDFLYISLTDAGIRTFKDDEELRIGEEFSSELLRAINQSKISIPIFSKGYASSAWCLKELAHMVECQKTKEQKIMPIFYDVAPSEVRHQTGSYGEAFLSHENNKRYDEKTLREWKAALEKVSFLNGWDLHNMRNRQEGKFAKELTQTIFTVLKKAHLVVSDYLVNVDNQVDKIMKMIGAQSRGTRIIGMHGMGGIGKTTIAKLIYNKLSRDFENCCFLPDIRETSKVKSIPYLQNKLISDVLKTECTNITHIDEGTQTIKDKLSNKRVLLLLDDVEKYNHMRALVSKGDWLGEGSTLIITTRNKDVLKVLEVHQSYEVNTMDPDQSLELFSKHAFGRDYPLDEYIVQSNKAIQIAGGLPLALEVMGSLLYRKTKEMWDATLEKLANVPHDDVQSKLKISYDVLDEGEKEIFLDIACHFIGYDKDILIHFWDEPKLFPKVAMEVLQNLSLIKIEENKGWRQKINTVWMHDQIRDFGRMLVSKKKIEKQTRVWNPEEALNLMWRHKGQIKAEALCLSFDHKQQRHFAYKDFERLSNLRFLKMDSGNVLFKERLLWHESPSNDLPTNENSDLLPQLRWLSWHDIPPAFNITNFSMEEVVILDLSYSDITDDWKGWNHMKVMKNLKVLDLSACTNLQRTPIFSSHPNLERLFLYNCHSLIEIDVSICQLRCLVSLGISGCDKLQRLPDELGRGLAKFEFLCLAYCPSLERLPDSIGNLKLLIKLDIFTVETKELPDSIGGLANLKFLSLYDCYSLERLPDSIGNLKSLIKLDISRVKIKELPDSIGGLANLKFVSLYDCNSLERLPDSIGNLKSLNKLDISRVKIKELPDSIGGLAKLKFLYVSWCHLLERLPDSIGNVESLIELKISNTKIKELPDSIGNLKELKAVYIEEPWLSKISDVLWSMGNLEDISASKRHICVDNRNFHVNIGKGIHRSQSLTTLTLMDANIYELPRLPESLIKLKLYDLLMDAFPDLSNLTNLKEMDLHFGQPHRGVKVTRDGPGCSYRHSISFSEPEPLDLHSHHVTPSPTNLALPPSLDSLRLCCFNLHHLPRPPSTLSSLHLENCAWLFSMEDLSNLKKLSSLRILDPPIAEIQGLGCLENLRSLKLFGLGLVKVLSDLTNLNKLTSLTVDSCDNLVEIQGEPQSLEELRINSCKSLRKLPNLSSSTRLQKVEIDGCDDLVEIQGELPQSLKELMIQSCESLRKLPNLSRLIGLHEFYIMRCNNLVEIQGELPQSLELLRISFCEFFQKLPYLSSLARLREVYINHCDNLVEIPDQLPQSLEFLFISNCQSLQELPNLSSLNRLQEVHIECCEKLNVQAIYLLCLEKSIDYLGDHYELESE